MASPHLRRPQSAFAVKRTPALECGWSTNRTLPLLSQQRHFAIIKVVAAARKPRTIHAANHRVERRRWRGGTMALNIKNAEAHALAARVARATGESLTEAVTVALRERLLRIEEPDALAEGLLALGRDCAERLKEAWRSADHAVILYDDR